MKKIVYLSLTVVLLLGVAHSLKANNVSIGNVSLSSNLLSFDLSWDNSWRVNSTAPYNYDAIWLFVKYQDCATNQWNHALIDSVGAATPLTGDTVPERTGVMVYRSADGVGNISNVTVTVRLTSMPSGNFDFRVFGVEMVYVPEGAFSLGDGASTGTFRRGTSPTTPYTVVSESSITLANSGANLYASGSIGTGTIVAAFPKGYAPFYCMKYEISQQQYVEFLNTLTSSQASARRIVTTASRYTITGSWPVATATAGNRAMNYMSWDDLKAYLDWSGLRPMTELEFEKACRGPATFAPNEYAWGTTLITDANTVSADGTPSETVTNPIPAGSGICNYNNSNVLGPLRCGFRGTGTTDRRTIGATYYGVCEMSGNIWERCIYVGNSTGLSFRPNHGDGYLTPFGAPDVPDWPAVLGTGHRGGSWISIAARCSVSDRNDALFNNNTRYNYTGGRGVRTR